MERRNAEREGALKDAPFSKNPLSFIEEPQAMHSPKRKPQDAEKTARRFERIFAAQI